MTVTVTIKFNGRILEVEGDVTMPTRGNRCTAPTSLTLCMEKVFYKGRDIIELLAGSTLSDIQDLATEKAEMELL